MVHESRILSVTTRSCPPLVLPERPLHTRQTPGNLLHLWADIVVSIFLLPHSGHLARLPISCSTQWSLGIVDRTHFAMIVSDSGSLHNNLALIRLRGASCESIKLRGFAPALLSCPNDQVYLEVSITKCCTQVPDIPTTYLCQKSSIFKRSVTWPGTSYRADLCYFLPVWLCFTFSHTQLWLAGHSSIHFSSRVCCTVSAQS